jgi:hypothetical protein
VYSGSIRRKSLIRLHPGSRGQNQKSTFRTRGVNNLGATSAIKSNNPVQSSNPPRQRKYKTINNWAELKTLLKDHYRERRTMAKIQMELLTCRQGKTDVRSFATKIKKILRELDDVCISSQGENAKETIQNLNRATVLKAFVDGLHDSIKLIIKACRFDDLPTAIEAACDEERNVAINSRSRENNPNQNCKKCGRSNHITSQCRYNNYSNAPNQTSQN